MIYRPGGQNGNVDALSRLPLEDTEGEEEETPEEVILALKPLPTTPVKATQVAKLIHSDPILSRVQNFVLHGWSSERKCTEIDLQPYYHRREELSVIDGCLLWELCLVIPPKVQQQILEGNYTKAIRA